MSEFRKGQRVRVTFEAEYGGPCSVGGSIVYAQYDDVAEQVHIPPGSAIELVEDLRPGDIVFDARGDTWLRGHVNPVWGFVSCSGRHFTNCGDNDPRVAKAASPGKRWHEDAVPARPLTLLVRDGQPVTP